MSVGTTSLISSPSVWVILLGMLGSNSRSLEAKAPRTLASSVLPNSGLSPSRVPMDTARPARK